AVRALISCAMMEDAATLIERLRQIVGADHVLTTGADVAPYVVDCRDRYHGVARAVVRPASTDDVAAIVRACSHANAPIVAQGGNTGMCGAATPDRSGKEILLSLARMHAIRAIDAANS